MNILQPRCLSLVQRHIVLRRPPSVGMPRHALRRRMPNIRISAVAARCGGETPTKFLEDSGRVLNPSSVLPAFVCGGETPTKFLEDSGRVLNPSSVLPAFVKKIWIGFGISWSNHRILKLERPPPDFPKISAPHRVPYPGKFFSGHTGDR